MKIDLSALKQLREETQISLEKCKKALEEAGGDLEKAKEILKKEGIKIAEKKKEREAKAAIIETYLHPNRKIGVLLKIAAETDFVTKNELFLELAHNLALQIAAMNPSYISPETIPENVLKEMKEIYLEEIKDLGKPKEIMEKIVEGKLQKRFEEICLLEQPYIKDPEVKVKDVIKEYISKLGENITILDFARFEV